MVNVEISVKNTAMHQPVLNVSEEKTEEMVETGASKRENLTWNNQSEPVEGATDFRNSTTETPELKCCFSFFPLEYFGLFQTCDQQQL